MHYYPFNIGSHVKKTTHLSTTEEGALRKLLDWQYSNEMPLPASEEKIFKICRARQRFEKSAVGNVLDEFFPMGQGGRWNPRAAEEVEKFRALSEVNAEKGRRSGAARRGERTQPRLANGSTGNEPQFTPGSTVEEQRARVPRTSNQEPVTSVAHAPVGGAENPTLITQDMAREWHEWATEAGADYTWAEVQRAWLDYHSMRLEDGQWRHRVTTKTALADWRAGLEQQIQHNRAAFPRRSESDTGFREPGSEKNREKNAPAGGGLEGMSPAQARFKWERELEELEAEMQSDHELNQPPDPEKYRRAKELREKLKGLKG